MTCHYFGLIQSNIRTSHLMRISRLTFIIKSRFSRALRTQLSEQYLFDPNQQSKPLTDHNLSSVE
jgi:hypothetical protein